MRSREAERRANQITERPSQKRVAYVVKMYPRYSETFIVSEILAHEAAGLPVGIFSLRAPVDTHFQDLLAKVRSPVRYIFSDRPRVPDFWTALGDAGRTLPQFWNNVGLMSSEDPRDVHQAALLASELRSGGFTHVHAHFASVATSVARMAARFAGIPYTFTAHAKDIYHESVDASDFRRKLTDAAATVTVSDHNLDYLRRTYGKADSRVRRIYNGLHIGSYPFSPPRERDDLVVAVGRLVEKKGFDDLIRAMAELRDSGARTRCEIIGAGEMEGVLSSMIASHGLGETIKLTGPLPQREVIKRVSRASLLAAPCVSGMDGNKDGLPTVLLEAMALGTPCIATRVAGIPEAIRGDETGLCINERDVDSLAAGITRLLGDPDLRCRLALSARRVIESDFDIDRNAAEMRNLFGGEHAGAEAA